jgi:homoserine O-acetyltransferase
VTSDILFPLHQQQELAKGISGVVDDVKFVSLDSTKGHDSFLVDMDAFRPVVCDYFEQWPVSRPATRSAV